MSDESGKVYAQFVAGSAGGNVTISVLSVHGSGSTELLVEGDAIHIPTATPVNDGHQIYLPLTQR
jgi:hypothetical protein